MKTALARLSAAAERIELASRKTQDDRKGFAAKHAALKSAAEQTLHDLDVLIEKLDG